MFLAKFLVVVEVVIGDGGRRCRSSKVERAIEETIRGRGGRGLSSGRFLWWDDEPNVY